MTDPATRTRESLLRGALKLQAKLFIEAARDLVLSPLTLVAAAVDMVLAKQQEPRYFDALLRFGERSDRWIDLWSSHTATPGGKGNVDGLLASVEEVVRDPHAGARRAKVLKRWAERQLSRARRAAGPEEGGPTPT